MMKMTEYQMAANVVVVVVMLQTDRVDPPQFFCAVCRQYIYLSGESQLAGWLGELASSTMHARTHALCVTSSY